MKNMIRAICLAVFISAGMACGAEQAAPITAEVLNTTATGSESTGPTVLLEFDSDNSKDNSISTFMYFVPMISTVPVDAQTSPYNRQRTRITTYERKRDAKSFEVTCQFEMRGTGYHRNTFDAAEVIKEVKDQADGRKSLKNLIDYIMFKGSGTGSIKVQGSITDGLEQVETVEVKFNEDGRKSPATIGLYAVKPDDGSYKYENKSNQIVARVNTLKFSNNRNNPKMEIELASIKNSGQKDGFLSNIKGRIANLFIKPIKVSPTGNDAMMDFGYALYKKHASFTFPKAKNLKIENEADDQDETVVAKAIEKKTREPVSTN